ncbi:hypothetical protein [Nonomuraea helvata]|uniref:AraC family transcriptional regulator n=1 Tax=Nonomuraea helvata TaxID=37484 RepID=A0ABV5RYH8_9ACTN
MPAVGWSPALGSAGVCVAWPSACNSVSSFAHVLGRTAEAATVRWALEQIDAEPRDRSLASTLVTEHLALVMLIHLLRLHLAVAGQGAVSGWMARVTGASPREYRRRISLAGGLPPGPDPSAD